MGGYIFQAHFGYHGILMLGRSPIKWRHRSRDITIAVDWDANLPKKGSWWGIWTASLWDQVKLIHGHQSSSFIAKCNDNKFICGTSHYAAAEFETCKRVRVLLFYCQLLLFKTSFKNLRMT